jgi:serine/tyrosine/threonine adenylyltransferase
VLNLRFDNRFRRHLPGDPSDENRPRQVPGAAWSPVMPTPVKAPRLIAHSREMAEALGLDQAVVASPAFAEVFAGNALLPGMQPYAANYGGHQFGHWAGQLGDGRAIALGEAIGADGRHWELQLKGAGTTPYSRHADGRAVLRSSVREFLCSEAMHHLGIPTTRALSLVSTGESVVRDMFYDGRPAPEPGAIVCRTAASFLRLGSYQLPTARGEHALLAKLVDFTLEHLFAEIDGDAAGRRADWFAEVCRRTALLMADWMRVGFVHGVMNTDNLSVLGLTLDYGPYGWVDDFDPDFTPNTTDAEGRRYRFAHQPGIAYWNLQQFAAALAGVIDSDALKRGLDVYVESFQAAQRTSNAAKLGLPDFGEADEALLRELYGLMRAAEMDMTLTFRALSDLDPAAPDLAGLDGAFYDPGKRAAHTEELAHWLARYAGRVRESGIDVAHRRRLTDRANPRFILRNWLAQQAIERAEQGDESMIHALLEAARHPCEDHPGHADFRGRRPEWARNRAGCSMLSCSS